MAEPVSAAVTAVVAWVSSAAAATASAVIAAGASVGLSAATTASLWNAGMMAAASTAMNAVLAPRVGAGGSPTAFKADPAAPVSGVMGRFGVAGRQAHMRVWGKGNLFISYATILSLGPIQGVPTFTANGTPVTFPGPQGLAANVEPYKDKMWMTYKMGLPTDGALGPPTGVPQGNPPMDPPWTVAHKTSGYAMSFWTMRNNSKRASYEGGVPRPQWTVLGMRVWDPRKDSTYPGGNGPQRRDDWRTWEFSENPYLHAIAWALGHHKLLPDGTIDRTKRLAGIGAPYAALLMETLVDGANVADANGWVISGEWTTMDDKWQTFASMLQAGGGEPLNLGAQIGCYVNAPKVSIYTLTPEDLAGGAVSVNVMASRRDRFNTVIPRYRDENQKWEQVAAGPVTSTVYRDEDRGEPRTREIAYNFVRRAKQAAELAAYDLANTRETLRGNFPCKPHILGLRAGDAFTARLPEVGLNGQKMVARRRPFDPGTAIVGLEARSETDAKHAWALGQAANPAPSPSLTALDPVPPAALPEEIIVVPRPPEGGGAEQPGLIIDINVPDGIGSVLVEVGLNEDGPWAQVYQGPPTTEKIYADGLSPQKLYWVAVTYYSVRGVPSERSISGPWLAGRLIAEGVTHIGDRPVGDFSDLPERVEALDGEVDAINTEVGQQRTDLAGVAAGLVNNGVAITQEAQRRETNDEVMASTLGLIGARSPDGLTFIIDRDKVMVGPGVSFAQRDSLIEAKFAGTASSHIFTVASTAAEEASASAEALRQMGVDLGNASAWQLDSAKIKVTPTETLNQRLISIGTALTNRPTGDEVDARVTSAMNAGVGADGVIAEYVNAVFTKKGEFETRAGMLLEAIDGVSARASLFVDANGRVGGVNVGAEQERIDLEFAFDRVFFVDVSSGARVQVLNYIGGQWTFDSNVRITGDLLVDGTIRNEQIQQNTITGLSASYQAGQINLNGTAPVVVAEVWTAVEKTGSPVLIDFNAWLQLRHDASGSFTSTIEIRRSADTGIGVQILTHTVEGSGMANDTFAGMVPFKVIDRPGPGFWRYFVRISSNTDNMSVQNSKTRYISATEYKTNQ
jgi:hypothetical protein